MSCVSAGECAAVRSYIDDNSHNQQGVLLTESGGTWAPGIDATPPANAAPAPGSSVSFVQCASPGNCTTATSVSCASAGNCRAVGAYIDGSGNPGGLLLTETNGTWARGVGAASPGSPESQLASVSCASAGNCSAVGAYGVFNDPNYHADYSRGLLLNQTVDTWTSGVDATPPTSAADVSVSSVSCASPGNCTAVGSYTDPPTPPCFCGDSHGLLLSETGGKWAPGAEAALPANAAGSSPYATSLSSVSCDSGSDYCSAVGSYTDSSGHGQGLLVSTASTLSDLQVSPKKLALAGRGVNGRCVKQTDKNRKHRPCTRSVKLNVSYQLNFPAAVTITIKRVLAGRLGKGRCVAPTHKNRKHRRCTRLVPVRGSLATNGAQGSNSFGFNGRIGGHKLAPGTYQLTATTAGGNAQTVTFQVAT